MIYVVLALQLIILFGLFRLRAFDFKAPVQIQKVIKRVGDTYHICEFCKKNLPDVTLSADQHWACSKCRKIVLAQ
jgi:acetoacetate decarboxylase